MTNVSCYINLAMGRVLSSPTFAGFGISSLFAVNVLHIHRAEFRKLRVTLWISWRISCTFKNFLLQSQFVFYWNVIHKPFLHNTHTYALTHAHTHRYSRLVVLGFLISSSDLIFINSDPVWRILVFPVCGVHHMCCLALSLFFKTKF
jgi:hypothetical protein